MGNLPINVLPPGVAKPPTDIEARRMELLSCGWKLCRWMEESKSQAVASNPNRFFRYFGEWASMFCEMLEARQQGGAKLFVVAIMKAGLAVVEGIR